MDRIEALVLNREQLTERVVLVNRGVRLHREAGTEDDQGGNRCQRSTEADPSPYLSARSAESSSALDALLRWRLLGIWCLLWCRRRYESSFARCVKQLLSSAPIHPLLYRGFSPSQTLTVLALNSRPHAPGGLSGLATPMIPATAQRYRPFAGRFHASSLRGCARTCPSSG